MPTPKTHPTPHEWIKDLRVQKGHDRTFLWSPSLDKLLADLPEDSRLLAKEVWRSRVGRPMSSILDEQFERDLNGIKPILDREDTDLLNKTPFFLYPSYDFNAFAGMTSYGDPVLAVHTGLPHTLLVWAHAFVRSYEVRAQGGELSIDQYMELAAYLADTWEERPTDHIAFRPKSPENYRLGEELANASLCFVVAHEIGHMRLKHESYTSDILSNHAMEYEADRHGATVTARYALLHSTRYDDTYFLKFMIFAPYLALSLMSLFGDEDSDTHPSPTHRIEQIIGIQPKIFQGLLGDLYPLFLENMDSNVFEMIAKNAQELLEFSGLVGADLRKKLSCTPEAPTSLFRRT